MQPPPLSKRLFDKYDVDKSGSITPPEFKKLCYELGHFLNDGELAIAIQIIDKSGTGNIKYSDFLAWYRESDKFGKLQLNEQQQAALNQASEYFRFFDKDHNGTIDREEFKDLHADLVKNKLTTKNFESCLEDLDTNKDGVIQFNEYIDWLCRIGSIPVKVI